MLQHDGWLRRGRGGGLRWLGCRRGLWGLWGLLRLRLLDCGLGRLLGGGFEDLRGRGGGAGGKRAE